MFNTPHKTLFRLSQVLSAVMLFSTSLLIQAQDVVEKCGIYDATVRVFGMTPERLQSTSTADRQLERETALYIQNHDRGGERDEIITIPVVFHVIHNNGTENIAASQIHDALEVVNRDYNALNEDLEDVIDAFSSITGNAQIEFKLARKDPNGNCHSGINRIVSEETYVGDEEVKLLIQWPRNRYLNVWVCAEAAGTYSSGQESCASPCIHRMKLPAGRSRRIWLWRS